MANDSSLSNIDFQMELRSHVVVQRRSRHFDRNVAGEEKRQHEGKEDIYTSDFCLTKAQLCVRTNVGQPTLNSVNLHV